MSVVALETQLCPRSREMTSVRRHAARKRHTTRGTQFAQLNAFAAVAEQCSFTRAAEHLGLSTPSLSHAIRALEEDLGVKLLARTTRSVTLTEAGERLLGHLGPVLEGVDYAIDSINALRDTPAGTLRLSVHPLAAVTIIAPLVAGFSAAYPNVGLEVSVDLERKDIIGDHFDAGIHPGNHVAQDMIAVPIGTKVQSLTVASPHYLAGNPAPKHPDDLRHHNCICYRWDRAGTKHAWQLSNQNQTIEVSVDGSLIVNDIDIALRAALDGLGIVQLPHTTVSQFIGDGSIVSLLPQWSPRRDDFVLYYSSHRHVPTKLRAFIDYLKKESRPRKGDSAPAKEIAASADLSVLTRRERADCCQR
jgi:DNA-binding transcriptional LysR family regulator